MTKVKCDNYKEDITIELGTNTPKDIVTTLENNLVSTSTVNQSESQTMINKLWYVIKKSIDNLAKRCISFKEKKSEHFINLDKKQERHAYKHYHILKDIKTIRKFITKLRNTGIDNNIEQQQIINVNIAISKLNNKHNTQLEHYTNNGSKF